MFKKAIEAVILDGEKRLEELKSSAKGIADQAQAEVDKRKSEIKGLVELAKNIPDNVFGRFSTIMIGEFMVHGNTECHSSYAALHIGTIQAQLAGLQGSPSFDAGKYRAVVLLERITGR